MNTAEFIKHCDSLLRAGRVSETARHLRELNTRQIPASLRIDAAKLCRRAGLPALGLKILAPHLKDVLASLNYKGHEAILLQRVGVLEESLKILGRLDGGTFAEVFLYTAFGHIARWDYAAAENRLREYIRLQKDPYQNLVGRVNLAAALVHCRRSAEADPLLEEILEQAEHYGYDRLAANSHELKAELRVSEGRLLEAEAHLIKARATLSDARVHDQLFIEMRQAQIDSIRSSNTKALTEFRALASERADWESVRETDLQLLKLKHEPERFQRLIAGTPHQAYRLRVLRELGLDHSPAGEIRLGTFSGPQIDLARASLNGKPIPPAIARMIGALVRDLYRPRPAGALFWEIYPGEHFDIFTSPNRIHRLVLRTRRYLEKEKLPLEIDQTKGSYSLRILGACGILTTGMEPEERTNAHVFVQRARTVLTQDLAYTNEDFRLAVGLEKSQVNSLLAQSQSAGLIRVLGKGRGTRYRFVPN
jgi:tetratricopeptide (TPR) repeat protein